MRELSYLKNNNPTPHIGVLTQKTYRKMIHNAFENIRLFEMGQFNLIEDKKIQ